MKSLLAELNMRYFNSANGFILRFSARSLSEQLYYFPANRQRNLSWMLFSRRRK